MTGRGGPPGFPSLKTLELRSELKAAGVEVLGAPSRRESLILTIKVRTARTAVDYCLPRYLDRSSKLESDVKVSLRCCFTKHANQKLRHFDGTDIDVAFGYAHSDRLDTLTGDWENTAIGIESNICKCRAIQMKVGLCPSHLSQCSCSMRLGWIDSGIWESSNWMKEEKVKDMHSI